MSHFSTADAITGSGKTSAATNGAGVHSTKCGTNSAILMPSIEPIEHFTNFSDGFVTPMAAMRFGEAPRVTEPEAVL